MNGFDLYDIINNIDKTFIEEAAVPTPQKSKTKKFLFQGIAAIFAVSIAVTVLAFINKEPVCNISEPSTEKQASDITQASTATTEKFLPFAVTTKSAETDSFSEDELHHIEIILDGDIIYRQMPMEYIFDCGFSIEFSKDSLGELLGTVTELTDDNKSLASDLHIASCEPSLSGCEVYYFKPVNCKAALIVKNDNCCGLFVADHYISSNDTSYKNVFSLFGIENSSDIEKISFEKWDGEYDATNTAIIHSEEITSENEILRLYEILTSSDCINIEKPIFYDICTIRFELSLKNGLILGRDIMNRPSITYLPYKANGELDIKGFLTPEQNADIKNIFGLK